MLDFGCGNRPAFENTSGYFSGSCSIYRESPATKLASLKATFPSWSHLFILHVNVVAGANLAVDCQVVSYLEIVFRAKIDINNVIAGDHLAPFTSHHDAAGLFAARIGEAI